MKKRILTFIIACCMLFALVGLTACNSNEFPSPVENFTIDDFNDEFFENYSLVMVGFSFPAGGIKVEFYTVFLENGYINFLINIYVHQIGNQGGWSSAYAVILSNETLANYAIGEVRGVVTQDEKYTQLISSITRIDYGHGWLRQARRKSINHRVGHILSHDNERVIFRSNNNNKPITNVETLNYLIWNP